MSTKICFKCHVEKAVEDFGAYYHNQRGKSYIHGMCKPCRAIRQRTWMSNSALYYTWANMIQRCTNPNRPDYNRYGGRGIRCCQEWLRYQNFKTDMLSSYRKGLQLDRIDNNSSYCKENCRWSTVREQAENRRNTKLFTYNGKTMTLPRWAEYLGIKNSTLRQRFYCLKWPLEKALTYNIT